MGELLGVATGGVALLATFTLLLGGASPLILVIPFLAWGVLAWVGFFGTEGLS